MLDVEVIDDPAAATVALDPVRSRLLAELAEPAWRRPAAQSVRRPGSVASGRNGSKPPVIFQFKRRDRQPPIVRFQGAIMSVKTDANSKIGLGLTRNASLEAR